MEEVEMLEAKFLSNGLEMLSYNCKFLLDNSQFSLFSAEMYGCVHRILVDIQKARSQYINEMRFSGNFLNMK